MAATAASRRRGRPTGGGGTDEGAKTATANSVCRCAIERRCYEHTTIPQEASRGVVGGPVRIAVAVDHYFGTPLPHLRDADPVAIRGRQLPTGGQIVVVRLAAECVRVVESAIHSRILVAA